MIQPPFISLALSASLLLAPLGAEAKQSAPIDSIDVSKDLIALGIADQNLPAGNRNMDAGPLVEAAMKYANSHHIPKVTIPSGDYFFHSSRNTAYIYLSDINNVTLSGNRSNFIFDSRKAGGILLKHANNIGFENITLDYAPDLPFSTAVVGSVDLASKTIHFAAVTGRPVSELDNEGKSHIKIVVFRKTGTGLKGVTGRLVPVPGLLGNESITIQEDLDGYLKNVQPGDIAAISERNYAGYNMISLWNKPPEVNTGNFVKNVTIYSAPAAGIGAMWQTNFTASGVRVEPKPGREQYISSNADGVAIAYGVSGNKVFDCYVNLSGDDGLSFSTPVIGTVISNNDRKIIAEIKYSIVPGQTIAFADQEDLHENGCAAAQQITPTSVAGGVRQFEILLDKPVAGIQAGTQIFLGQADRAPGTVVQHNVIEKSYARGIYFSGIEGIKISNNIIRESSLCGIYGQRSNERPKNGRGWSSPGNTNTLIEGNTVDDAFAGVHTGGLTDHRGAIEMSITNGGHDGAAVNENVTIKNNTIHLRVSNSTRHVGVYIANTKNYILENNRLQGIQANGVSADLPLEKGVVFGPHASNEKSIVK